MYHTQLYSATVKSRGLAMTTAVVHILETSLKTGCRLQSKGVNPSTLLRAEVHLNKSKRI